jgi:GDP-L-fucose synthase
VKITITGAFGFLGQHLAARLQALGHSVYAVSSKAYDLRSQAHVDALFHHTGTPDLIFHLAAHVGGIAYNLANPATIYYDNVMMNTLLINKAAAAGVKRFVFVGSTCAYPGNAGIPTAEEMLWEGYPEESNGTYGISKRIVLPQLQAYKQQYGMSYAYPILCNMYGPGDDFSEAKSHVVAALIRKFCANPETVEIWGDGTATRDFLYVEDAAAALCCFLACDYEEPVNIAGGVEVSIKELAHLLRQITGYRGTLLWDYTKPMGQRRRCYSIWRAYEALGWEPRTGIEEGLRRTVEWYRGQQWER